MAENGHYAVGETISISRHVLGGLPVKFYARVIGYNPDSLSVLRVVALGGNAYEVYLDDPGMTRENVRVQRVGWLERVFKVPELPRAPRLVVSKITKHGKEFAETAYTRIPNLGNGHSKDVENILANLPE